MDKKENKVLIVIADMGDEEKISPNTFDTSFDEYSGEKAFSGKRPDVELVKLNGDDFKDTEGLKRKILSFSPSCVFNRFEGWTDDSYQEVDFARVLEETGLPFTGNSSYTLGLCLDKWGAKEKLAASGVPVPPGVFIKEEGAANAAGLRFPLFVKPCFEDASIGIDKDSFVRDEAEFLRVVSAKLKSFPRGLLAEEFIPGNEYAMAVIGNGPYEVLGLSVLDYSRHEGFGSFLTYDSKWISNAPEYKKLMPTLDADISSGLRRKIEDITVRTAEAFKCRGYLRVDMRERDGEVYVLDVNPNPDISEDSGFMRMARKKGYTYEGMLNKLIDIACEGFAGRG